MTAGASNSRPVVTPISALIDLLDIRDLHDTVDLVWSQMRSLVLRRLQVT
jgi:hypothetical protein